MFEVKNLFSGQIVCINRRTLEVLRMLMDKQLVSRGYDPQSVNEACNQADDMDQAYLVSAQAG